MPVRKPIPEVDLGALYLVLIENHMGEENRGTRATILSKLFLEWQVELTPRQLRQAYSQLNASNRPVCPTSRGTYLPTSDAELEKGCRFIHNMAMKLLKQEGRMRAAWEAKKLTADAEKGAALATANVGKEENHDHV